MSPAKKKKKSDLVQESAYAAQVARQHDWLNWFFAATIFLYAVTALQFQQPWKVCFLGLFLIIPLYAKAFKSFPPALISLRRRVNAHPQNTGLKTHLDEIERRFHGWGAARELWPVWISWVLYLYVFASGLDGDKLSWLRESVKWIQT